MCGNEMYFQLQYFCLDVLRTSVFVFGFCKIFLTNGFMCLVCVFVCL